MSWRDDYQLGSFRGVPFKTQRGERRGGRRVETHEYPRRDRPWGEDLGRSARQFTIDCFVGGPDYFADRDRLIAALEEPGPGALVHPWQGTHSVNVVEYSTSEDTEEGGIAYFTIDCVESGLVVEAVPPRDSGEVAREVADAADQAAVEQFSNGFTVGGMPTFVEDAGTDLVRRTAAIGAIAGGLQGGVGPALRAFETGLAVLPGSATTLVRSPLALGQSLVGLMHTLGAISGSASSRIAGLSMLVGFGNDLPPVVGSTPARVQQRRNQAALVDLVTLAAGAELVRAIADAPLASYQEAVTLRDDAAELLERRFVETADADAGVASAAFAALLRAMVADVTDRGGSLARVYTYVPIAAEPSLVIAHRLYGAGAALLDRHDDLVARNRLSNPTFVPGGVAIEVLESDNG